MFDLLNGIRYSIRRMDLHQVMFMIDQGGIMIQSKLLDHPCKQFNRPSLGFYPQIIIPCIMPAALVQSGYLIS